MNQSISPDSVFGSAAARRAAHHPKLNRPLSFTDTQPEGNHGPRTSKGAFGPITAG
jgi:hypothetical protein